MRTRTAPRGPPRAAVLVLIFVLVGIAFVVFLLGALRLGRLELGGDERVVLGAQIDFVVEVEADAGIGFAVGLEALLALEGLDLLNRDLELVRDPRVRAALAYPGPDPVQLGA